MTREIEKIRKAKQIYNNARKTEFITHKPQNEVVANIFGLAKIICSIHNLLTYKTSNYKTSISDKNCLTTSNKLSQSTKNKNFND